MTHAGSVNYLKFGLCKHYAALRRSYTVRMRHQ